MHFNVALNYGSRIEILDAVKALCRLNSTGEVKPEEITDELFSRHLYTSGQPDPDLLIRTSGEFRISNFLLGSLPTRKFTYANLVAGLPTTRFLQGHH